METTELLPFLCPQAKKATLNLLDSSSQYVYKYSGIPKPKLWFQNSFWNQRSPFMMAAAVTMSAGATSHGCFRAVGRHSISVFSKRTIKLQQAKFNGLPQNMFANGKVQSKPLPLVALATDSIDISISSSDQHKAIMLFYETINEKKLNQLEELLSDDCFFEDYSFPKPFHGKQEVMQILEQLITAMGQNMEFNVKNVCEGEGLTAAVNWHLDWKKKQVPFTRGCSYFELSRDRERLVIKKIEAVIESPIKPGGLALVLFKIANSLFNVLEAAARFLQSQQVIFQLLMKMYTILQPILNLLLAWFVKLWSSRAIIISFMLNVLQYIAKIFKVSRL